VNLPILKSVRASIFSSIYNRLDPIVVDLNRKATEIDVANKKGSLAYLISDLAQGMNATSVLEKAYRYKDMSIPTAIFQYKRVFKYLCKARIIQPANTTDSDFMTLLDNICSNDGGSAAISVFNKMAELDALTADIATFVDSLWTMPATLRTLALSEKVDAAAADAKAKQDAVILLKNKTRSEIENIHLNERTAAVNNITTFNKINRMNLDMLFKIASDNDDVTYESMKRSLLGYILAEYAAVVGTATSIETTVSDALYNINMIDIIS
jgi:hypothetical protein